MKSVLLLMFVFTLLLFAGCSMEESTMLPTNTTTAKIDKSTNYLRMDLANHYESYTFSELSKPFSGQMNYRTSGNMSSNGHFSPVEDWVVTFSGMQNNAGLHGNAIMTSPIVGFHMSAGCMAIEGNEAVYGGLITQVFYQDDEFFAFLEPGMYCAFKVKDNGEGHNAPKDQVGTNLWFWWDDSPCQYLPPSSEDWGPMMDVLGQGDEIQVK